MTKWTGAHFDRGRSAGVLENTGLILTAVI